MNKNDVKAMVWEIAVEYAGKGSGWTQEGVVLREVRDRLQPTSRGEEQMILDAWHDLFAEKRLGWGTNLDNPNSPFFHLRERVEVGP